MYYTFRGNSKAFRRAKHGVRCLKGIGTRFNYMKIILKFATLGLRDISTLLKFNSIILRFGFRKIMESY